MTTMQIRSETPADHALVYALHAIAFESSAEGLSRCRQMEILAVVVLGHPDYYPRFGFNPSVDFGIASEYDLPPEVFMLLELDPGSLSGKTGTASYHSAFGQL